VLLAGDHRGDALDLFLSLTGMAQELIEMRRHGPGRARQEALAATRRRRPPVVIAEFTSAYG
jgi:hypothetical protein